MILIHVTRHGHDLENHCISVESHAALFFLLSMLEREERVTTFTVSESNSFRVEKISDLKSRFNISNTTFAKWRA